jgi:hypothetical protein
MTPMLVLAESTHNSLDDQIEDGLAELKLVYHHANTYRYKRLSFDYLDKQG